MANRFSTPDQQFVNSAGLPYAGGFLYFYASGTSTPLATYSNATLTIANTNPIVLGSAGGAGNVFLQNLAYKVVLQDANAVQIWTADPVYSSDFSTNAQVQAGAGSPNGSVAGTAGSSGIPASMYWDTLNNILYIATTTGSVSTTVWTAVNAASAAAVVPPPRGYLTPVSGTPIIVSDSASATAIYYTPYLGSLVPIYTGSAFTPTSFSELTLTLTSSQAASTIYDVFVFNNSGVLTLVTGPAWATSTAGAGARGTGAGTTQLQRLSGTLVNAVQITGRNGASTYSVAANRATYLGSLFIDSVAGQVTCHRSIGQNRKWGIWNAYNRNGINLYVTDPTASWAPGAIAAYRPSNNSTSNKLTTFCGLAEETVALSFIQSTNPGAGNVQITMGINSTTTGSGRIGTAAAAFVNLTSDTRILPAIGINNITSLEKAPTGANFIFGTETDMIMQGSWLG